MTLDSCAKAVGEAHFQGKPSPRVAWHREIKEYTGNFAEKAVHGRSKALALVDEMATPVLAAASR